MLKKPALSVWIAVALLALALALMLKSDLGQVERAAALSREGSPAPALDPASPTGYALGQRHFLGTHERGDTWRWIAATQQTLADGLFHATPYTADNVPEGRPQLAPRLYTAWLAGLSWALSLFTGESVALSVERAALWDPVIAHLAAFAALVVFMARRHGALAAGLAGLCFALFPPFGGQFLPGVLSPRPWALLLTAAVLVMNLPRERGGNAALGPVGAVCAGLALWLDPAFGFPAVLVTAVVGAVTAGPRPFLRWAGIGAVVVFVAWLADRSPWTVAAGELRYVHPLYAFAWLGLGLALDGWQRLKTRTGKLAWTELAASAALLTPLVWTQFQHGYKGWLYSGAALRRLTSLDETVVFDSVFAWLGRTPVAEIALLVFPLLVAVVLLARAWLRAPARPVASAVLLAVLLLLACFKVRWGVVASVVALPLLWPLVAQRKIAVGVAGVFLASLLGWGATRPPREAGPGATDLTVLIHRHFAHWLASHHPGQPVAALAPPELSDALVFHGGVRVLMSTAWEAHAGQVAASRLLSAPESSEAEAVLQSRQLTHVVLTSWDPVLPLLVKQPDTADKDTLYARLQRWVLPRTLRAVPYQLPGVPGYADQKLAVFKVTPPQDEALALSRLAEYFVEMDRREPAQLAAKVLAQAFADDPNAVLARALVYAGTGDRAGFERELNRLAADAEAGRVPFTWDRRVQRAILLALGRRSEIAKTEAAACLAEATAEDLFELTPLQAYRLGALARSFGLGFPSPELEKLTAALGAEYHAAKPGR